MIPQDDTELASHIESAQPHAQTTWDVEGSSTCQSSSSGFSAGRFFEDFAVTADNVPGFVWSIVSGLKLSVHTKLQVSIIHDVRLLKCSVHRMSPRTTPLKLNTSLRRNYHCYDDRDNTAIKYKVPTCLDLCMITVAILLNSIKSVLYQSHQSIENLPFGDRPQ
jgi:hypothetical protein